ncbi:Os12g0218300 [Oryza sativa Japonica Group]|uniref:Os12g0218300 protein n=2 Tax=Oryza sativa subsp. japonica TaxID=39947 RepID=A0A8J8YJS4_ORYSJ|nr:expressed protein [Oryza sativa Japonica Group]EAZ19999.1 hypothetical protein OsJ_35593 [Oryza sativa Japonica Group]BAF29429.1 Os12g0218300 [Oryza sativa Japonica Group]BAG88538.1 unnamed protein product [Oryza sativa Japonica Group]BAT16357.1 Os12g0218300 [Oryza sativa Japonica Group]|eukprot:NP_001066410.1 Os12g0218300 [Oryza sativa Japonica Group]
MARRATARGAGLPAPFVVIVSVLLLLLLGSLPLHEVAAAEDEDQIGGGGLEHGASALKPDRGPLWRGCCNQYKEGGSYTGRGRFGPCIPTQPCPKPIP